MLNFGRPFKTAVAAMLAAGTLLTTAAPSFAQDRNDRDRGGWDRRDNDRRDNDRRDNDRRDNDRRPGWNSGRDDHRDGRYQWRHDRRWSGPSRVVVVQRPPRYKRVIVRPTRYYRDVRVVRRYGYRQPGFGFYYRDDDALRFLGLTALSLVIFNQLSEAQQRTHEAAMIQATSAPIGERIVWNDGRSSGTVVPLRDGTTTDGRYCREFQQEVTVGGRREDAYGTACQQPDGSWQIIDS